MWKMMEVLWALVGLLCLLSQMTAGKLTGPNICQEEHRYTKNVTEYFQLNSTVREYQWCMNVPPRCSYYTINVKNESRIVEKEVTDVTEKCCLGFKEDQPTNTCVPLCPVCINGICKLGKCVCKAGFKGENCDIGCEPQKWGEGCQLDCACQRGACNSTTGKCECPPGWNGNQCQSPCQSGFHGKGCRENCKCRSHETCHSVTGNCETTIRSYDESPNITVPLKNNGKFKTDQFSFVVTSSSALVPPPNATTNNYVSVTHEDPEEHHLRTDLPVSIMKSSKAKVAEKEVTVSGVSTPEEIYLDDEAFQQSAVDKNDLVNSASAASAIAILVILVAVAIVAAKRFKKMKKDDEEIKKCGPVSTVSVYTHSIFHTPLPDPPTFENPVFVTPIESNCEGQRFETRVVCSMNFPSHPLKDPKEYLYDHPPSTGSYRAASIPEPPDTDIHSGTLQSFLNTMEPVYDEIPSGVVPVPISEPPPSYKSSSLYMNTCGKSRL